MALVSTARGLIDRSELQVVETHTEDDQARYTRVEWFHQGTSVRMDALVNLLRGQEIGAELKNG